jgi:large subunit ribosomal protein L10e
MRVITYPHQVIREHKMATGAGADRISQGMSLSFGRPIGVAARIKKGQSVFLVKSTKQNRKLIANAFRLGMGKLSGSYKIRVEEQLAKQTAKSATGTASQ